jgi:RND family efflux transporter MFP subunit
MNSAKRSNKIKVAILIIIIILFFYWMLEHPSKKATQAPLAPTVVTQKPQLKKIKEYITQTGTLVAFNSVNLVARIKGFLETVEFTDGSFVKKGKQLFLIEPLPYLEQLREAQATVTAQKAGFAYARSEHDRQKRMFRQNATSLNNVEKWAAKEIQSQAQIDEAVANAAVAAINYSYTHVLAPFDGRIGRHLVDPGNLVGNGEATNLATIEQIDPIYAYFNLNELDLIRIRESVRNNNFMYATFNEVPVFVKMQNEKDFSHEGKLNFVNTGLNASTGTMEFRALLSNKDFTLLPGLFVQVRIPVSKATPQLTIPDTAILYDQIGPYVLTVNKDNYVKIKRVTLGAVDQGIRAIAKGLNAEDSVIISGLQNASPGNKVSPIQNGNKKP